MATKAEVWRSDEQRTRDKAHAPRAVPESSAPSVTAAIPSSPRRVLLLCGIASSLLYVTMNVFVPMRWGGYNSASQTVSELSAVGAPTRPLWVVLALAYTVLVAAFGLGVWASARRSPALRVVGASMIATAVIGLAWPPMHQREALAAAGGTLTDTLHLVWSAMWGLLALLAMGFGATALGRRFRLFTAITVLILVGFGTLTGLDGPRIAANLPTPWVGVWERVNIGAYMLWIAVLAAALLRAPPDPSQHGART